MSAKVTFEVIKDGIPWRSYYLGGNGLKNALIYSSDPLIGGEDNFIDTEGFYIWPLTDASFALKVLIYYQGDMYSDNYLTEAIHFVSTEIDKCKYFIKVEV